MKISYHSRIRIVSFSWIKAVILILILPFVLVACGGGAGDVNPSNVNQPAAIPSSLASNSATLAWDPSTTATNLSGYRLYYGTASGTYLQPYGQGISVGNITTYTLMGLSNGTRYYFAVTAFDTSGNESGYSNVAFKDVP